MEEKNVREKIVELLKSTGRARMDDLIHWMDENGFFTSACSTHFHLAKEGGLAEHSYNVYRYMREMICGLELESKISDEQIIIVALLHDLGKTGDHGKAYYIKSPLLKSGKEAAKPYMTNPELTDELHEIRSLLIAERFIYLSEDEETAILHHNGLFGQLDSSYGKHNYDSNVLSFFLHMADMYCSRFIETKEKSVE